MLHYNLFKIKPSKLQKFLSWCADINEKHRAAAQATLEDEHCLEECFFLIYIEATPYALGIGYHADDSGKVDPKNPLNIEHRKIMHECLELISNKKLIYRISTKDE